MKNCTHCKHADWQRTAAGKLHPSGDGRCMVGYRLPPLPASMYWLTPPYVMGGHINRRKDLEEHCTYFVRGEETAAVAEKDARDKYRMSNNWAADKKAAGGAEDSQDTVGTL